VLTLALALAASPSDAQIAGAPYCSARVVYAQTPSPNTDDPVALMHPVLARARYAKLVEDERWSAALSALKEESRNALAAAGVAEAQRTIFGAQVDSVVTLLQHLPPPADTSRARFLNATLRTSRFAPHKGVAGYHLFGFAEEIDMAGQSERPSQALCWSAMSIDQVLFRLALPLDGPAIARLQRFTTSWANFRSYGYTRQPLEMLLFRGKVQDTLPPRTQWMVGHLSLGADVHGSSADSLLSSTVTVIEIGGLRYRNDYTQYSGLSAIATLGADRALGVGLMLHAVRSMRAGALYHPSAGGSKWSVVTSTDLYGLLEHSKRSVEQGLSFARGKVVLPNGGGD
jgi:hypothetical protein